MKRAFFLLLVSILFHSCQKEDINVNESAIDLESQETYMPVNFVCEEWSVCTYVILPGGQNTEADCITEYDCYSNGGSPSPSDPADPLIPMPPNPGGSGIYNPPSMTTNDDIHFNQLCGYYSWKTTGSAFSANIAKLGVKLVRSDIPSLQVHISFPEPWCIVMPSYGGLGNHNASEIFNFAWNQANIAFESRMNRTENRLRIPTQLEVITFIKSELARRLRLSVPGSTVSSGACLGVPISYADYCHDIF